MGRKALNHEATRQPALPQQSAPQVLEIRRISNRLTWLGNALHVLAKGKCTGEHLLRHIQQCEDVASNSYAFLNWQLANPNVFFF